MKLLCKIKKAKTQAFYFAFLLVPHMQSFITIFLKLAIFRYLNTFLQEMTNVSNGVQ